jgi:predicted nucleic acid-binding protein
LEISYGLAKSARRDPRIVPALTWFTRLASSDLVVVQPLDAAGALIAGRLRAEQPVPPTGKRRSGSKPEQRAGWLLDIQIAACAWVSGAAVVTANRRDFDALRVLLAGLYPSTPPLDVQDPPEL